MNGIDVKGELSVKFLPNGRWVEIQKPVTVRVDCSYFTVAKNFQTDFASVPRIFWNILPPFGLYTTAAVIHDWMYYTGVHPKKRADEIFYRLMIFYGVSGFKARIMYLAVKWFGGGAWKNHRQKERERTRL